MQIEDALRIADDPRAASNKDLREATVALACGMFWKEALECHQARIIYGFTDNKHAESL